MTSRGAIDLLSRTPARAPRQPPLLGIVTGEGIGPEVSAATLMVLDALGADGLAAVAVRRADEAWLARDERSLTAETVAFFEEIFAAGGVVLSGPVGGRFVYELRRRFDLFCKLVPIVVPEPLRGAGRLRPECLRDVDVMIVRENVGGLYQGTERVLGTDGDATVAIDFSYSERDVRRVADVAAELASTRRGDLQVVVKRAGVPKVSDLWIQCAEAAATKRGVRCTALDVDYAAYHLIQHPERSDVIVTPNLFGDVLSDLGAALLGSRGLGFSANFSAAGTAVYQTTHGAAFDLAGTDRGNPAGHMRSLAMLLRVSFGLPAAADRIEHALAEVWKAGWTTDDLAIPGARAVGTARFAELVAAAIRRGAGPA